MPIVVLAPRDVLARDVPLPALRAGDVVAFAMAGAYAWNISHTAFPMHPAPRLRSPAGAGRAPCQGCAAGGHVTTTTAWPATGRLTPAPLRDVFDVHGRVVPDPDSGRPLVVPLGHC